MTRNLLRKENLQSDGWVRMKLCVSTTQFSGFLTMLMIRSFSLHSSVEMRIGFPAGVEAGGGWRCGSPATLSVWKFKID